MAIFHLSQQVIGRGNGKSAMAASAYRACVKLVEEVCDKATGIVSKIVHDYRNKKGLEFSVILAPDSVGKDSWVFDRQKLWSNVQNCERRVDAQFAREFNIALPIELSREENKELIVGYVQDTFVSCGMVADISIHYDNPNNPHAHVMLTMRDLVGEGDNLRFGLKNRDWNDTKFLVLAREAWSNCVNNELAIRGFDERITHKSFKELGINIEPTRHEGVARHILGSDLVFRNREIVRRNAATILENPEIVLDSISKTVFSKADLEAKVLDCLRLDTNCDDEIMASKFLYCMEKILSSEKLVKLQAFKGQDIFTSLNRVDKERSFVDIVKSLNSRSNHQVDVGTFGLGISDQQKSVVVGVCSGQDISVIEGLPGSGKTTTVREIVNQYRSRGYKIFGASTSSIATRNLGTVANIDARTIAKWKYDLHKSEMDSKTVFIIDEMSMVDFESCHFLLDAVNTVGCKVVLLGDTNQFSAIGVKGAATKIVEICGSLKLDEVHRHSNELHRKATKYLGNYQVGKAFDIYESTGSLRVFEKNAKEQLVLDYVHDYLNSKDQRHVVLGYKNDTVNELNTLIRQKLVEHKVIDVGIEYKIGNKLLPISVGEKIIFCMNDKNIGVLNGEEGVVTSIDKKGNLQVNIDDRTISFNTSNYSDFKYGYAITCYKSQGATYDTVKVLYEDIMNYETFNVMMTRHKHDVGFYVNRHDLIESGNQYNNQSNKFNYRTSDIELLKGRLESKFSTKTSNLLSLDFLDEKCQKIKDYIEVKNMIRLHVKNINDTKFDVSDATKYLSLIEERTKIAQSINDNIQEYKDYLGYARISMSEIQKNTEPSKANKKHNQNLKNQFKEEALVIESKIILKQDEYDYVIALKKHCEVVNVVCEKDFNKTFALFKDKRKAEDKFREIYLNSKDKTEALNQIKNDPTILGELKGFKLLGFATSTRKQAIEEVKSYFTNFALKEESQLELKQYVSPQQIKEDIQKLQDSLQELIQESQIQNIKIQANKDITKNRPQTRTQRTFIKYDDIRLSKHDHEELFKQYIGYINPQEKIKKFGNEIKCGSLSMDLEKGLWLRFATSDRGNIYQFISYATGVGKKEALEIVARHVGMQVTDNVVWDTKEYVQNLKLNTKNQNIWQKLDKIPEGINLNPETDLSWMKQKIEAVYEYRDIDNNLLGYTIRCYDQDKKKILPIVLCTNGEKTQWMSMGFGNHLYGVEKINQDNKDIIIVEGEKTADAAQKLLPEYTVVSFAGVNKLDNIDFKVFKDRNIIIWPDNDDAGISAAKQISTTLSEIQINHKLIDPTKTFPDKWDLADELPMTIDKLREIVSIDIARTINTNKATKLQSIQEQLQQQKIPIQDKRAQIKPDKDIYELALNDVNISDAKLIGKIAGCIKAHDNENNQTSKISNKLSENQLYKQSLSIFENRDQEVQNVKNSEMTNQIKSEHGEAIAESFVIQLVEHNLIYGQKSLTTTDINHFKTVAIQEQRYTSIIDKTLCKTYKSITKLQMTQLTHCIKSEVRELIKAQNFTNLTQKVQAELIHKCAQQIIKDMNQQQRMMQMDITRQMWK